MKQFKDKVILIVGEANSLSMGIIYFFLKEMATVVFPARSLHQVETINSFRDINDHTNFITLLIDPQDFDKLLETGEAITEKFGKIDISIEISEFSNSEKNLTEASIEEWNNMIEKDMLPFFMGARVVLNLMNGNHRSMFVHISDIAFFGNPGSCGLARVAYTTRLEMSKIFAEEAKRQQIRYYHLWVEGALECTPKTSGMAAIANAERISNEISELYNKETYDSSLALQSFPKVEGEQV